MRGKKRPIGEVWLQLRSLGRTELILTAAAMMLRLAVGIATWILPYRCWRHLMRQATRAPARSSSVARGRLVGAAVGRTDYFLKPQGACLIRALTGYVLLRLVRGNGRIRLGILGPANFGELRAHAWLVCDGEVLIGEPMSERVSFRGGKSESRRRPQAA